MTNIKKVILDAPSEQAKYWQQDSEVASWYHKIKENIGSNIMTGMPYRLYNKHRLYYEKTRRRGHLKLPCIFLATSMIYPE